VLPALSRWQERDHALLDGLLALGIQAQSVPGGCALIAGLVCSGLPTDRFSYLGCLPAPAPERRELLRGLAYEPYTLAWTVQDVDLAAVVGDIEAILGDSRKMALCWRDVVWRGLAGEAGEHLALMKNQPAPGTGFLFVQGSTTPQVWTEEQVRDEVGALLAQGISTRDAAQAVSLRSGWRKRAVYRIAVEMGAE
jgi:16S rRNA (cytidine1402-2'-O)-methyltransferase